VSFHDDREFEIGRQVIKAAQAAGVYDEGETLLGRPYRQYPDYAKGLFQQG